MPTGIYKRKLVQTRFLQKVKKIGNGCWIWLGFRDKVGYGKFHTEIGQFAHRFSYFYHKGEIPIDKDVCHSCDNPSCVNPEHLWLGTHDQNMRDMVKKGRANTDAPKGEQNGLSKLTDKKVLEARKLYKQGVNQQIIGRLFGVSSSVISRAINGVTWKHLNYKI